MMRRPIRSLSISLDPTKLIPEELVPVRRIGKMTLDRNPDSFFAETEQVAFCTSHVVPGIDFTNDPLLQGRNFSYQDTQLSRLGGPNFNQIPINQPQCPFHNNQRDGHQQMQINVGRASYDPNSLGGNFPKESPAGFASFLERIEGDKRRVRADSFKDHFSQAQLFWNSQSEIEKEPHHRGLLVRGSPRSRRRRSASGTSPTFSPTSTAA